MCSQHENETAWETAPVLADPDAVWHSGNWQWSVSRDVMLVVQFDAVVLAANPASTEVLGWTQRDLTGRSFFEFLHPDDVVKTQEAFRGLLERKAVQRFENQYRHKDGSYRWIAWTAVADERAIYAIGRDGTVEKRQAEALEQAEGALRQSLKMEAVGQLTGGLTHDFNNMLAIISGNLELLRTRLTQGQTGDLDHYVAAAQGATARAAALANRLLAFSRQQPLSPKATDANRLIDDMAELIRRTVGPSVAVEMALAPDLWATLIDRNQFENALLNLCNNARDAMSRGGRLTIITANICFEADAAHARGLPVGQHVAISVSDTGCGMAPEVIERAFAAFFTTKRSGMGTGLGLSMVDDFVRQSGGQTRIESAPGQGTRMWLYLPRHLGAPEQAGDVEAPVDLAAAPRAARGETVLVVDDEPTVREMVTEVLEELGYNALAAADGVAGLRALRSDEPIDLLITDVGLPGGMDGEQMAEAGRAIRPNLKVLFITGYLENAVINHTPLHPAIDVLTKPFAMEKLARCIKKVIEGP